MSAPAAAQGTQRYPSQLYYLSLMQFHDGEYRSALKNFHSAAKSGLRVATLPISDARWVDSICYYTMLGECYYHMGDLGQALEHYNSALQQLLSDRDWMLRIQFPDTITPAAAPSQPATWAGSTRRTMYGHFPDTMLSFHGRINNEQVVRQGGIVTPPSYYSVDAEEIVRCTTVALRRRAEIMGAAGQHDPLTSQVLQALSTRSAPPNHWSQAWHNVQLGLAYIAAGKLQQGAAELTASLQIAGQFDHPLTGTALLELGKLAFAEGQYDAARNYFFEATFPAARYEQYDLLEEAFRHATVAHLLTGQRGLYPPLLPAANWAGRDSEMLSASLSLLIAENHLAMGDAARASGLLTQARRQMSRRDMAAGQLGARVEYLTALVNFQTGNVSAGESSLSKLLNFQRGASRRLFQIKLVDTFYTSAAVTPREADQLFAHVLREPTARDWAVDPVESLSVLVTPQPVPLEHWFQIALERGDHQRALEIADRIRRQRFYSTLPLGGRLLALRWLLEAPEDVLPAEARLQRQDLLVRYPRFAELARQSEAARAELRQMPLITSDQQLQRRQSALYATLAQLASSQELILHEIALRREASPLVFPPLRSTADVQQGLKPGQAVLCFFATSRAVYGFTIGPQDYRGWQLRAPREIRLELAKLLRGLGNYDGNQALDGQQVADPSWREAARILYRQLIEDAQLPLDELEELIIVPDSVLWHVPFEALPIEDGEDAEPLISRVRLRYAPTLSLAVADHRPTSPTAQTAVIVAPLLPGGSTELPLKTAERLAELLPNTFQLEQRLPGPAPLFANICDRLVVLSDIDQKQPGPYQWSPIPIERSKPAGLLSAWMVLPWGGPDQIVLPGFHTVAEAGLKRSSSGDDIFLTLCGLMSTGTRTILLSRWRTGGQISMDLTREFVQELPHTSASDAWQRSVQLGMNNELDPQREPRLQNLRADSAVKAQHPFFWAGYLLVDSRGAVEQEEVVAQDPEVALQEPAPQEDQNGEVATTEETEETEGSEKTEEEELDGAEEAEETGNKQI